MKTIAAALLAACLAAPAAAARVTFDVDLARELGPVRDQRDIGWCYANAVADILGWKYRTPAPVSA
ncbi:MAG: hypothetical protein HY079_11610, partial [Elusimicrobia bacterium]|nr:hypothetical protein [Elusimicrobiota bacterium]